MATRRGVLKLIGGGTVVAATAAVGFVGLNQPSKQARAAWGDAGEPTELRRWVLSYALLAPNPHNRQPWQVKLEGEDALTLYCDLDRRLPATDPYDRQITIGLGAFLELLSMAAAERGFRADMRLFPEGERMDTLDARPIAHVRFIADDSVRPDPLFAHVLARRSNREDYKPKDVSAEALEALMTGGSLYGARVYTTGNTPLAAQLRALTWQAHKVETLTPRTHQESVDVMRIGRKAVTDNPDGVILEGPLIAAAKLSGAISLESLADPTSSAFQQGLDIYERKAMSARAFAWLTHGNAERSDQINAGRAYVQLNLTATQLGLAMHPWSQALQEYPEMASLHDDVHALIGGGERIQMLVRVGHAPSVIPAPRWPLDSVIKA